MAGRLASATAPDGDESAGQCHFNSLYSAALDCHTRVFLAQKDRQQHTQSKDKQPNRIARQAPLIYISNFVKLLNE